jgi:hypothetical protein
MCLVGLEIEAIGSPADSDQDPIEFFGFRRIAALEEDSQTIRLRLYPHDLGTEKDIRVALLDAFLEGFDEISVAAGDQLIGQLDHGNLRAQCIVHRGHLETDDATADHEQSIGHLLEQQCVCRVHDSGIVSGNARQLDRPRASGNDAIAERNGLQAVAGLHRDLVTRTEPAAASDHGDLPPIRQCIQPLGQTAHDSILEAAQPFEIEPGFAKIHALFA